MFHVNLLLSNVNKDEFILVQQKFKHPIHACLLSMFRNKERMLPTSIRNATIVSGSYYQDDQHKEHSLHCSCNIEQRGGGVGRTMHGATRKQLALGILVAQNTALVLMLRYSRTAKPDDDEPMYIASTAVVMAEVIKMTVCLIALYFEQPLRFRHAIRHDVLSKEALKMAVPAGLYALQNNWLYVALSNLEAAAFQVTYQLKTLSTAVFSIVLLGRTIDTTQWIALVLLMVGVTLVQLQVEQKTLETSTSENPLLGLVAVLASCVSSGFAGCYFERLLKRTTTSMWVRNLQLGVFALVFSVVAMATNDGSRVMEQGFFVGYHWLTWLVIFNQALGGLVVSMVVKYAGGCSKKRRTRAYIG